MVNKKLVTKLAFVLMVAVTFFAACATAPKSNKMDMKDDMQMKSDMNMKDDMKSDMMKDGKKK